MSLKDKLLEHFLLHPDESLSGEKLAETYHVSRAAVWKAVKAIREDGYDISSSASGYCFTSRNDVLNAAVIKALRPEITAPVYVFQEIDSTNNYAKILAAQNAPAGTVVIANHQTAGRGRQGHTFYSPKDTGLYFSLIIHPGHMEYISRITPAAAVAACEAIAETTGIRPGIKWVNDLFIGRQKIAGILSEAVTDFETGRIDTVIIGIGINCRTEEFPDEIRDTAGSLNAEKLSRNLLAAVLREKLMYYTSNPEDPRMMDLYRRDSIVIGKNITYTYNGEILSAFVTGINDDGNLLLTKKDCSTQVLQSGEISIKDWQIL